MRLKYIGIILFILVGIAFSGCTEKAADTDSDGDGWTDEQEIKAGTDQNVKDTDGDGLWDPKDDNPLDKNIPNKQTVATVAATPTPKVVTPTPTPALTSSKTIEQIKTEALKVSYDDLMRDSDNYIGKIVYFRVGIIQVNEISSGGYLFIAMPVDKQGELEYVPIRIYYEGKRFLNGDMVDVWGTMEGVKTYISTEGGQLSAPVLTSLNLELVKKSGTW